MPKKDQMLHKGHCLDILINMRKNSIHLVLTDPPYFLDGLDENWKKGKKIKQQTGVIGKLPVGMKFDKNQGHKLQTFIEPIMIQLYRILKPGGFMLMFSSPRLYHRIAIAAENTGFEIRDQYAWRYHSKSQFKAFSQDHFIKRRKDLTFTAKKKIIEKLDGRKTPQLRPQFESILCAQKPKEGTHVENWLKHKTGLIDANQKLSGKAPETVITIEKETATSNIHLTPKPIELFKHLIQLFSIPKQTILDPFLGSGTTSIAAYQTNRKSIGIDINPQYIQYARRRLKNSLRDII